MKKIIVLIVLNFIIISSVIIFPADSALAEGQLCLNLQDAYKDPLLGEAGRQAGYKTDETFALIIVSRVIYLMLSFLGVVFLLLTFYGGYVWMLARGNEQEVEKAKSIIRGALIGLVIVVGAYAISWLIISKLGSTTLKESPGAGSSVDPSQAPPGGNIPYP